VSESRDIHVTLTVSEYVALYRTVTGELESFTELDWEDGRADDLDRAKTALVKAWKRAQRRHARKVAA